MRNFLLIFEIIVINVYGQVNQNDIKYYLWNTRTTREQLYTNNYGQNIIENVPVKILIHGWGDSINSICYPSITNNYNSLGYNIIATDWSRHSSLPYTFSVSRLSAIAPYIADFIIGLSNSKNIPLDKFHLIGHSLGGQLSGFTGKNLKSKSATIGRITGLDPAGPGFNFANDDSRLSSNDASKVDVIHTDAGNLGISQSLGNVDFWVNGGTAIQPGCFLALCSHVRSCFYFSEGILSDKFVSRQCPNRVSYRLGSCNNNLENRLGENVDFSKTGNFYLSTNSRSSFARS